MGAVRREGWLVLLSEEARGTDSCSDESGKETRVASSCSDGSGEETRGASSCSDGSGVEMREAGSCSKTRNTLQLHVLHNTEVWVHLQPTKEGTS